ncbi:MAG: glutamate--tRNA ligase, partial [Desulfobacterales bacterium]|nr:glutamate--tRNA ligase [Desulfobacterales bacterium]
SDGMPIYNLAVVVDDITMGINTVVRGDDHVMNTPKQILLYKALEIPLPTYGHVPMVLGKDKSRLSKRHGAVSVTAYRDMGCLPDAFINYLVRLGWSHGDQEFFTREELIEKFTLENIGRAAGVFDLEKLLALNADHIKASPPAELTPRLAPFLKERGQEIEEGPFIEGVIQSLAARSKTLDDMARDALFYFGESVTYEEKAAKKFLKPAVLEPLRLLVGHLEALSDFTETELENAFKRVMEATGLKLGKIAQPVRVSLTGRTASPGIFEIIELIGKGRVVSRIKDAIRFIEER